MQIGHGWPHERKQFRVRAGGLYRWLKARLARGSARPDLQADFLGQLEQLLKHQNRLYSSQNHQFLQPLSHFHSILEKRHQKQYPHRMRQHCSASLIFLLYSELRLPAERRVLRCCRPGRARKVRADRAQLGRQARTVPGTRGTVLHGARAALEQGSVPRHSPDDFQGLLAQLAKFQNMQIHYLFLPLLVPRLCCQEKKRH